MLDSQTHTRSQRRSPKTPQIKGKTQDSRWAGLTDPSRVDGRNESGYNDYIGVRPMKKATIGSRELKTRLGTYLRQVQQGRTLIVTERGRPVAELKPIPATADGEQDRMDELIALGVLTRQSRQALKQIRPLHVMGTSLSAAVIEGRKDRL
jgi:prevent-host-death family protein